jgi:CRP-like cAMP-binding protein
MDESRLRGIALFARLSKRERTKLARHLGEVEVPLGGHLVKEGERSHEFFVIEEGTAAVISGGKHVTDLGPGDFLGEIGLLRPSDRTASVIATSPIRAIVMAEEDFRAMSRASPEVARQIDAAMEERLERDRMFGLDRG